MSRAPKPAPGRPGDASAPAEAAADLRPSVALPASLLWRFNTVVEATGMSRRTIERLRSSGKFPKPDIKIGKAPLWKPETVRRWIDSGGKGEA